MKRCLIFLIFFTTIFFSCDDIIEVEDISSDVVLILAPTSGSIVDLDPVSFTWEPIEDAENYHLQIAIPNFEEASQVVLDTVISKTNFEKSLEASQYEWRVKAQNSGYSTEFNSTKFVVE
ncbi:hypothetical protein NO995_07455 [Aestuariibaculum sp. M13]|uniref:hypothetical protein n=1 Tax=unclassified Aestuariibaculum TaxID=2646735 RepID=UPI00215A00B5|nr:MULTISPECIES: hypothetical protein [unclassified Aestuariibaculum]MCR8667511.1 hypothetical protein [Aestuariibaculum sp. M13]WMI65253.1 hypothetical protein RBH94_14450 [Aestuariibaculum sp. YM273]